MTAFPEKLLQRIADGAAQRDAQREQPFALINEIKATGFGARRLAAEHGGGGASLTETFDAAITLAEADPNIAHIWRNHHVALERILNTPSGHPAVVRLRDRVLAGDMIGAANTELGQAQIGGGGPFASRLVREGSGYVLNGKKFYSTGSLFSDWLYIPVSLEDGTRVIAIAPKGRAGLDTVDDWFGMGQRLTGSGTTLLDNVRIEADEVLLPADIPGKQTVFGSTIAQLFLTAVIAGVVSAVARDAAELLGKRKRNFYYAPTSVGAQDPLLLSALGEREADAFAVRAIVLAAARVADATYAALQRQDADIDTHLQAAARAAAKAKITVDRIAHHAATALFDIAGASATLAHLNLDRHWRNIRTISTHNHTAHKSYALGNLSVNEVPLPTQGFF
ncbi:acyl-CoA dehydrogenase [Herbaspirillum chlorophenolicum]|uniref:acyl-CoA dehydrogenase n=1 Tax=Herbaspirillum chlorophenolicum TaxID=211589 RepID=UPI00067C15EC|nr:acyl-CoA dehydrogenase [Herbaspirillum chlorophenolicum]